MPRRSHIAVKLARNATPKDLASRLSSSYSITPTKTAFIEIPFAEKTAQVDLYNTKTLPVEVREWIWELFETNMKTFYEQSSDGWDPAEKRKELFHSESRFVVLRSSSLDTNNDKAPTAPKLLGYSIFRFDTEETASEDEDELCDVVYCYELQVEAGCKGMGVGRSVMDTLNRIGKEMKMDKTMLTVFKANASAVKFYRKIGFTLDEMDPSHFDGEEVDYEIMSKGYI
ncbi:hypothetical protein JCM5353_000241 [Sporobolomyces roseus]